MSYWLFIMVKKLRRQSLLAVSVYRDNMIIIGSIWSNTHLKQVGYVHIIPKSAHSSQVSAHHC